MKNKMIMTTTDSVDGKEIKEYLGIISDRIVVGAGLFSEFFAGFTDVFGGRSGKFEDRMHELYNQLMMSLESQAKKLRADAIVGLRIDMDEISGKNSQMFMISGVGTAIRFENNNMNCEQEIEDSEEKVLVTSKEIKIKQFKLLINSKLDNLVDLFERSKFENSNNTTPKDLEEIIEKASDLGYSDVTFLNKLTKIILTLGNENELLYQFIHYCETNYHDTYSQEIFNVVREALLSGKAGFDNTWKTLINNIDFSFSDIFNLMSKLNDDCVEEYIFPILQKEKAAYYERDIEYIEKIISNLKDKEYEEVAIETQRNGLKTEQVWRCKHCGNKISVNSMSCWNCGYDKYGLKPHFKEDLQEILNNLQSIVEIANFNKEI